MVKVREDYPQLQNGRVDLPRWIDRLPIDRNIVNSEELLRAFQLAEHCAELPDAGPSGVVDEDGSSLFTALEMVEILADLHLDQDSLVAAALYRAVREERLPLEQLQRDFGQSVAKLVEGVLGMAAISRVNAELDLPVLGQSEAQSETIRKMLVALVDDVRVALIKLAERTSAIRAVKDRPDKRYRVAREVFDIYAPLAHRLGIGHIKWELEDLSFRYLQPSAYKKIAKLLDEKRLDRQRYIDDVISRLFAALEVEGIDADIAGRAKHIYSIWRKMQRKGIGFSQVYDIRAVRVLVDDVKSCYTVLGLVHGLWRNVPNEFDDYIANPKENGYRSLHTAVIGPEGKVLEIQIRTRSMHEEAEFGVCSHWMYKGADKTAKNNNSYDEKIAWLRQVLDWHEESGSSSDVAEQFTRAQDRVYVFTPDGHVVNLQNGATPLDFAYHIHTEVGNRCRGAKVNGRIVPLTYTLNTGERVEILTGKDSEPRRDWLQSNLGYLKTSRARTKVQHWFRQQAKEDNITAGRALLEKEFRRLALNSVDYKYIADQAHCASVEDMYAAVGSGEISTLQLVRIAHQLAGQNDSQSEEQLLRLRAPTRKGKDSNKVRISGVGNLLTHFARCCKPLPGEAIAGYITVGRGVSVHRQDCSKLLQLQSVEPHRIIAVDWEQEQIDTYPVDIELRAFDRQGLLRDITLQLATEKVNVVSLNTVTDTAQHMATMRIRLEISDVAALSGLLNRLNGLPNVVSVERVREGG
ncbi:MULTISPECIES: GTP diphosphokinase [Spongiibacter]|uniref:GTP diphosphokinase n=1 Tax=Spongiibacter TaxID=630749 RepID=UPI000C4C2DD3|nr:MULTISPECIES: GTP diphosphokinase [Spongiibacter]MAY40184.1 GTP diphosphokinase [Spongiibacter sp.]MBI57948.1 GTP diphosphokinase [Spongiibacter sp.]MBU73087.1 GTP diphosphokinase [Spongiibacter sp.]|tara:strand:- start:3574 stop:5820 length:2247 start_codon:yes stop_codon:yes gene_type:complete